MGKESACNAGDPSWISGSGRSPGEGIGYPLQYSWASLVAQMIKNLPTMWETWVQSLGWENPLQKGTATHSSILAWRIPWTEETGRLQSVGLHSHSDMTEQLSLHFTGKLYIGKDRYTQMKKKSLHRKMQKSSLDTHRLFLSLAGLRKRARCKREAKVAAVAAGGGQVRWREKSGDD